MKAKLFSLIIILLAASAAVSCFDKPHPCGGVITDELVLNGDESIHTDFEGVYLTLNNLGASSISVTWNNDTNFEIVFGEGYSVEILTSTGEWRSVQKEEMSVPAIALMLPAGGELDKGYSFKSFDLSQVGKYRLRCEFWHDGNTYNTWVQFDVTEENTAQVNRIPDTDLSVFSDFLDREGFVAGMSQGTLLDIAEKYSKDLDPSIVPVYCHYDGEFGGGCSASGELFGYRNDYHAEDGKVRYTNMIYTAVEIEALALPYGIKYGDSIGDVLDKLGINRDIYKNTADYDGTKLALYNDGTTSLTLVNWFLSDAPVDMLYDIELIYTDKQDTLTRTVTLGFHYFDKTLSYIKLQTVDNYEK